MSIHGSVPVDATALSPEGVVDPPEVDLQVILNCQVRVLGTDLRFSLYTQPFLRLSEGCSLRDLNIKQSLKIK